ncbi:MAG: TetR/AcrR family transcriptional regulator [Lachnospiraceae bacterium]
MPRRKDLDHALIQKCVMDALLQLLKDRDYADLSVSDIAKQAGVHRATFYRHFSSKDEVLRCCLSRMLQKAEGTKEVPQTDFSAFILPVFQAFYENREQLLVLNQAGLSGQLLQVLKEYFAFDDAAKSSSNISQYRLAYRIGGIYSCLLLWFSHDMRETPEEMTKIAASL